LPSLTELAAVVNHLSLHVPLTPQTVGNVPAGYI